jgi:hypothetical protein
MWINVQRHVPRTTSSHLDTIELDELSARAGGKLATPSLPQSVGVQHHPEQFGQRWRRVHRLPDELGRDPAEFANGPGIEEVTVAERSSSPGELKVVLTARPPQRRPCSSTAAARSGCPRPA